MAGCVATVATQHHTDGALMFPQGFPDAGGARELVAELLRPIPSERLGAENIGAAGGTGGTTGAEHLLTSLKGGPCCCERGRLRLPAVWVHTL